MDEHEYEDIYAILNNQQDNTILQESKKSIQERINILIKQLLLPSDKTKTIIKKLEGYKYIMELPDLTIGSYIRWINLNQNKENTALAIGSFIIDILILENGIQIRCKNKLGRIIQIKFDDNLIFQKLTDQENILLGMMDCLTNDKISF